MMIQFRAAQCIVCRLGYLIVFSRRAFEQFFLGPNLGEHVQLVVPLVQQRRETLKSSYMRVCVWLLIALVLAV